jgi:hypothetical protein
MDRDLERAQQIAKTLASSGQYEDWRAIFRKMLFDGAIVSVVEDPRFTAELDRICAESRKPSS